MTKTASQKARAKAKRQRQNSKVPVIVVPPLPRRNNNNNASSSANVRSRGTVQTVNVPTRRSNIRQTYFNVVGDVNYRGKRGLKIRARDYMSSVSMATTDLRGAAAINVLLCPTVGVFANTRLGRFCSLYEKFVFTNVTFEVDTGAGSGVNGNYLIAYDKDPSDLTPNAGDGGIREYSAWEGTQMFPAGVNGSINFPLSDPQDFYYTNPGSAGVTDERLYCQGQVYVAYGTQIWSSAINLALYIEYEIMLFDPELGSLTSDAYMSTTGYTPSSSPGQAWPVAAIASALVNTVGEAIRPILDDSQLYRGFFLEAGQYFFEQSFGNNSAIQSLVAPLIIALDPTKQAQAGAAVLQNIVSIVGGTAFRTDRLTIPPGGANIFGSVTANTPTTGAGIRIIQPALNGVII